MFKVSGKSATEFGRNLYRYVAFFVNLVKMTCIVVH